MAEQNCKQSISVSEFLKRQQEITDKLILYQQQTFNEIQKIQRETVEALTKISSTLRNIDERLDKIDGQFADGFAGEMRHTLQEGFKDIITLFSDAIQDMKLHVATEKQEQLRRHEEVLNQIASLSEKMRGLNDGISTGLNKKIEELNNEIRRLDMDVNKASWKWVAVIGGLSASIATVANVIAQAIIKAMG